MARRAPIADIESLQKPVRRELAQVQTHLRGLFRTPIPILNEVGGHVLATWWAEEGWMDSGWVRDLDITFPAVYVQVFWVKGDGSAPVEMTILNPAPGTTYGWLARGRCHALEVAWPG